MYLSFCLNVPECPKTTIMCFYSNAGKIHKPKLGEDILFGLFHLKASFFRKKKKFVQLYNLNINQQPLLDFQ